MMTENRLEIQGMNGALLTLSSFSLTGVYSTLYAAKGQR